MSSVLMDPVKKAFGFGAKKQNLKVSIEELIKGKIKKQKS